jgi:ABC-2 type transport system ATP-binding protein
MQGIFQKENTDKALKYGIYRHLPTYEKIIRNLVSFYIKITDVNKTIKKAPILRDINLEFTGGKVYGLRGKNGSGKTMLMRAICGLITPDSGIIDIDGKILGKDISFPESIGVLIENPSFIGNYTGLKNLKVLASIQNRVSDEQIRKALKDIGLDPDDKRTYRKYSLGMKQKLGIAAAVMENPDIIILDEPINALDDVSVEKVHDILEEQKKRGAVIIIACHDKEELDQLSDEIIEISDGRIINKTC